MIKELAAVDFLKSQIKRFPETAIILGSGLGGLVDEIEIQKRIPYTKIPHFPVATVEGHGGDLIFGKLEGVAVLAMNGRFHYYEGYDMADVVFPLRAMKLIGVKRLIVTNAAGGLNEDFEVGDLMLIEDIISLLPENPLRGKNNEEFGQRFPDMSEPFDLDWIEKTKSEADRLGIKLKTGTYLGMQGPKLETKAEIRYCRIIGGDAVGMSTVPEVIAANHMGMKVLGISVITNESIPKVAKEFTHADVVAAANRAGQKLVELVKAVL
ncbi:purine-nucleoside phosphorylase [Aquiflexum sp. TKW24L]|uniref:purine-nucleoside phosphorylase n=1 Tax=Aquiflexum sp. TKW24L TaxID=2942212 RepID=UPI0020C1835D|nr:purine-nucleoside phosphorylase [Aquiflexum sp. TKW24L]MCL6261145.1 purine-nucleoside phosphorylase [Aquiflexum sp. TKW24L]